MSEQVELIPKDGVEAYTQSRAAIFFRGLLRTDEVRDAEELLLPDLPADTWLQTARGTNSGLFELDHLAGKLIPLFNLALTRSIRQGRFEDPKPISTYSCLKFGRSDETTWHDDGGNLLSPRLRTTIYIRGRGRLLSRSWPHGISTWPGDVLVQNTALYWEHQGQSSSSERLLLIEDRY